MSDTLSTDVKPTKNAFGLPTGELYGESPEEEVVEVQEEDHVEDEPEPQEAVSEETESEEPEEDILSYAFDEDDSEPVSEESEVDKLRYQVSVLEGRLDEQRQFLDKDIKQEAQETDEDEGLDFSNPQFRNAVAEKLQEDPSLLPVLMEEMMDRKLKAQARKLESLEAKAVETDVSIEQENQLKRNLLEGLLAAKSLGGIEEKIVEQVTEAVRTQDVRKSALLSYLEKNPSFAQSAEGVQAAVVVLAKRAEARAQKKGVDISMSKTPASNRGNRMMDKQDKPSQEKSWEEQKIESLLTKKAHPLDGLLGR
jgi:hypothetical protein